jgi:Uma2 family endonuclease
MAEREAFSDLDDLFEVLEQMQIPEGFKVEIIEGVIHVSPQRDVHWEIIRRIVRAFEDAFGMNVKVKSDVPIDFPGDGNGFAPDVALLAESAKKNDKGRWEYRHVEFIAEVTSKGTGHHDYGAKKRAYASAGVGVYLIVNSFTGQCHLHTRPAGDQYRATTRFTFGELIDLKQWGINVVLRTDDFEREQ